MFQLTNMFTNTLKYVTFMLLGCCSFLFILIFILSSTPVYLYRLVITKFVSRLSCLRPSDLASEVSVLGTGVAVEFSEKSSSYRSPRLSVIVNIIIEGDVIPINEVTDHIRNHWINARDTDGSLMYPEFQQYVESWYGFLFWKREKSFRLADHIRLHTIPPNSKISPEQFLCNLTENLLNKPFSPGISPWDVHLVQNYKIIYQNGQQVNQTAFILRIHQAMGDGFSIASKLMNGLCEAQGLDELHQKIFTNLHQKTSLTVKIYECFRRPIRILHDLGFLQSLYLRPTTGWHIPDKNKSWYQLYQRSNLIPISKLKEIKCKNDVSFTAVLLSCLSAGLSKINQEKRLDSIVTSVLLPVPGHWKKLRNEFTGTFFDLPVHPKVDSVTRLHLCENNLQNAKSSMIPHLLKSLLAPAILNHVTPIAKYLSYNRIVPVGLTLFRASDLGTVEYKGMKILSCDFAAGTALGVTGIGFMILSYGDYIRISATAEKSVVTRKELENLMAFVEDEMNKLYEL